MSVIRYIYIYIYIYQIFISENWFTCTLYNITTYNVSETFSHKKQWKSNNFKSLIKNNLQNLSHENELEISRF